MPIEETWHESDSISVTCFPYAPNYSHRTDSYSEYEDTFFSFVYPRFFLIFKEDIYNDFFMKKAPLKEEYYLRGSIPLDKYLIGIGNGGYEVDRELELYYYYFLYKNKEISKEELKKEIITPGINPAEFIGDLRISIIDSFDNEKSILCNLEKQNISDLIKKRHYYDSLKKLCDRYNYPLYDGKGSLLKEEEVNEYASKIKKYVLEKYPNFLKS